MNLTMGSYKTVIVSKAGGVEIKTFQEANSKRA